MSAWSERFTQDHKPTEEEISGFTGSVLWHEINEYLQKAYNTQPIYTYSKCVAQRGWNVKYQKSGKSLCTLYPMDGYFIALVVIGHKEQAKAEEYMHMSTEYIRSLYRKTSFSAGGRWLMIHVTSREILDDVKHLIDIRKPVKNRI